MDVKKFLCAITVEPVLFLYMMVIFIETGSLKSIINTKACLTLYSLDNCSNSTIVTGHDVVDIANTWNKYYEGVLFSCTLLMSFYVASWSDYLGRKIIMTVPLFGTVIASLLNATLSMYLHTDIRYFLISGVVSGLSFGTVGMIAATFSYLSDIVPAESRTKRILVLEAMIFTGSTLGTYITGVILHKNDLTWFYNRYAIVFTLEATLATVTLIYVLLRIPARTTGINESRTDANFSCGTLFSLKHIRNAIQTVFKRREEDRRLKIHLLIVALIFLYFGTVVQFTSSYFFTEDKLKWSITEFSNFQSVQLAAEGIALLIGLPVVFGVLGINDCLIASFGILSRILGLVLFGLSNSKVMIYSAAVLNMFSEFPVPTVRSMLSKLVNEDEKGKIFAVTTIVQNLSYFLGAFILPSIYHWSSPFFPGLCFEIVAGLQLLALFIFIFLFYRKDIVTVYECFENEDGSTTEIRHSVDKELLQPS